MKDSTSGDDWVSKALAMRGEHWNQHPIVTAKAKILTIATRGVLGLVKEMGSYQRESIAIWAHPATGKSTCIDILKAYLPEEFPGAGIAKYEFKPVDRVDKDGMRPRETIRTFENGLLRDVLEELDYEPRIEYTLAGKRRQLRKLLEAIAGSSRHLFLIFDEAQSIDERALQIFKAIVNGLTSRGIRVTTVLFGQIELVQQLQLVATQYRSDLHVRFAKNIVRMDGITSAEDMADFLKGVDLDSEWPLGSGLSYTQFLFPVANVNGFKFAHISRSFFSAFHNVSPLRSLETGLSMEYVAKALAKLCKLKKNCDDADMQFSDEEIMAAVRSVGYANRMDLRDINKPTQHSTSKR